MRAKLSPVRQNGDEYFDVFGGPLNTDWAPHGLLTCDQVALTAYVWEVELVRNKYSGFFDTEIALEVYRVIHHGKLSYVRGLFDTHDGRIMQMLRSPARCCYTPRYCMHCCGLDYEHADLRKCLFNASCYEPRDSAMDRWALGWRDRRFTGWETQ